MGEKRDYYRFMKINDAILSVNQKVNLIGVVEECGVPKKSRGSDCFCTLKILDESHSTAGISVRIFDANVEKLPRIISLGDIILLSHVVCRPLIKVILLVSHDLGRSSAIFSTLVVGAFTITLHYLKFGMKTDNGEAYALFNKKYSSFALYEGRDGEDFLPYQVSQRFCQREQDKKFVAALRKWLSNFSLSEDLKNFPLLREIRKGEGNKFACQILHTCEAAKGQWVVFVWDGTDTPPIQIENKLEDEMDNSLPLQLEPLPLSRDFLRSFPTVGSIFRVIIDQSNKDHILHLLNVGKWVIFQNVLCQVNAGLWYGMLTHFTRLQYLPSEDPLILERQRPFEKRLSMQYGRMPFWSFPWTSQITEVDYNDDRPPFVTLMDVLTHQNVTAKFRCTIRVVAALPWQAEDVHSPCGNYRMRLTLEDPTARIHAFVYGKDGEKFFDGYPSVDVLKRKLNKLLGVAVSDDGKEIKDSPRNPPWVQCCLKSYYLNIHDIWGSRHYRIFDTKLVG